MMEFYWRKNGARRFSRGSIRFVFIVFLLLLFPRFRLVSQSRADIKIFIPRPESKTGVHEQQDFFAEQFKMEIGAANYSITENRNEADYLVRLIVDNNEYWGQPDEKQYTVTLALIRAEDNIEIVRFSWPFTDMTEMYQWNLYLVYQAMANVPMTKEVDDPVKTIVEREIASGPALSASAALADDRWRNKWLYVNFSLGADMTYLFRSGSVLTDQGMVAPVGFLGAEIQFLDSMSLELDAVKIRMLHDTKQYFIILSPSAQLKWVFKPSDFAMVEPYAGAEFAFSATGESVPWLNALAGVQIGVRGGTRGAIIFDFGITYSLLGRWLLASSDRNYGVIHFAFSVGYKLGFLDRKKQESERGGN
ncbi:MAG: hypothetical protein Pg6C_00050 [Treponemataceae bacterium]|nr:MAG: hypothetical protein Pg6C_00050 [Treponemataceae bacterium]